MRSNQNIKNQMRDTMMSQKLALQTMTVFIALTVKDIDQALEDAKPELLKHSKDPEMIEASFEPFKKLINSAKIQLMETEGSA